MNILIAGAGIGGLSAALSLHAAGLHEVTVVESAPGIRPLGLGLTLLPYGVAELDALNLHDEVAARAVATAELVFYNRYGQLLWREPRGCAAGHQWPQLAVHRGHLQMTLARAVRARLGNRAIRTGSRVVDFTPVPGGRLRVQLQHSATGTESVLDTDVLIGADGVNSTVRSLLYPDEDDPRSNGMVMWRGTTWGRAVHTGQSMIVVGDSTQRLVCYPIAPGPDPGNTVLVNWMATRPAGRDAGDPGDWHRRASRTTVLRHFGDWRFDWLDIAAMIRSADRVYEYPMVDRDPLPRWTFGPVTLLGDAAHAMYPMCSDSATEAIVDGRSLAYFLATCPDLDEALASYEQERRPVTTAAQVGARTVGPEIRVNLAHQRAPATVDGLDSVLPRQELTSASARYAGNGGPRPDTGDHRATHHPPDRGAVNYGAPNRGAVDRKPTDHRAASHPTGYHFDRYPHR